eukprot:CAMPEP_0168612962 /NCGR_PEP_ID=MMETSP0449_2-20121227/3195_1 /TAXON_ID=1082188 /ORGANISM="Strombidium rassoulzadegani, Strain ras09" /LENGTH=154 /DNA_ID=CAMNT_0008653559 /DNA_START=7 /DNA_END=471 /DNA_ORIENTATION=+
MKFSTPTLALLSASTPALFDSVSAIETFENGPVFDISNVGGSSKLKFDVTVPENQYFAIAFGGGMINTDMVLFQATELGVVTDLWSTGYWTPSTDSSNDYTDVTTTKNADNSYTFSAMRELDTGDSKDTRIDCGMTHNWKWVAHSGTANLQKHN